MEHGNLHTLIPLADFKAILGLDDREDALSRYCLVTATYTIEQYCKRRLIRKKRFEFLPFYGDYTFPLRDYPVREVLAVYQTHALKEAVIVEPDFYHTIPDCGELEDIPFSLSASPALGLGDFFVNRGSTEPHAMPHYSPTRSMFRVPYRAWLVQDLSGLKVHYRAGYSPGKAPADLASACLELAAWNMNRYRGPLPRSGFFIGMTGNVRGNGFATRGGADGEHLETSMPENVRGLLEPYRRRTI